MNGFYVLLDFQIQEICISGNLKILQNMENNKNIWPPAFKLPKVITNQKILKKIKKAYH